MTDRGSCPETRESLARLDERIIAIKDELERLESSGERALNLASAELARRLDTLNHAHAQAIEVQATYLTREVFDLAMKELTSRVTSLEGEARESRGRLYIPMVAIAAIAAGLSAAAVRFLVR